MFNHINNLNTNGQTKLSWVYFKSKLLIFLAVFGPATITAMADNDAAGIATYSLAGAKLGYPILFMIVWMAMFLAITQEMGIRLALVSRKGLGDLIREHFGVRISILVFIALLIANMGTVITDLAAVKVTSQLLNIPVGLVLGLMLLVIFVFVIKGTYKTTEKLMLAASIFYLTYIFSALKVRPNWEEALINLIIPHGMAWNKQYLWNYLVIALGVLGTTVTPWGQFFISSFAFDKKIELIKLKYSQLETYWGAFLATFICFFIMVATAATLYVNKIPLLSGEQAALAIKPFAGNLAATLFALGILNAGFFGVVIVSLSTTYAFSEFFGFSGSLNEPFNKTKGFYLLFLAQIAIAALVINLPGTSLFQLAITTQALNAMILPLVLYFLVKLTDNPDIMEDHINTKFQKAFAWMAGGVIIIASGIALAAGFFKL